MSRATRNKKVTRAIGIGLAIMIAAISTPVSIGAWESEGNEVNINIPEAITRQPVLVLSEDNGSGNVAMGMGYDAYLNSLITSGDIYNNIYGNTYGDGIAYMTTGGDIYDNIYGNTYGDGITYMTADGNMDVLNTLTNTVVDDYAFPTLTTDGYSEDGTAIAYWAFQDKMAAYNKKSE